MHAEAVLLVDHGECEVLEGDGLLEDGMGADQDVDAAILERVEDALPLLAALAPGEERDDDARGLGDGGDGLEVLPRKNLRRRHQRRLRAGLDRGCHGEQRDDGLAAADIALQEADHAVFAREVGVDLAERAGLRARERVGQGGEELCA